MKGQTIPVTCVACLKKTRETQLIRIAAVAAHSENLLVYGISILQNRINERTKPANEVANSERYGAYGGNPAEGLPETIGIIAVHG